MYIINLTSISSFPAAIGKTWLSRCDLTSLADIEKAAKSVYPVINPRSKGFVRNLPGDAHVSVLLHIAKRIWEYFNLEPNTPNTQTNFDAFHEDLCRDFLSRMNGLRSNFGLPNFTYGIAQKYVNMLFKYLACFGNYSKFADLFSYCHIPIDRQILSAFKALSVPNVKNGQYKGKNWSGLSYADYHDLLDEYRKVLAPLMSKHPWLAFDFVGWMRGAKFSCATVGSCFLKPGTSAITFSGFFR